MEFLNQTTSKGNQLKFEHEGYFYKIDNFGYESIAEVLVSELEAKIINFDYIDYKLEQIDYNGTPHTACKSLSFRQNGIIEISLNDIIKNSIKSGKVSRGILSRYFGKDLVDCVLEIVESETGLDATEYLGRMIYLDAVTLNDDRHLNNISFRYNEKTGQYSPMPVYDNGGALLSNIEKYPMNENTAGLMKKVKSKPFSTSFDKQVSYFRDSVSPLLIDITAFNEKMEKMNQNLNMYVPFLQNEYWRAFKILNNRLKALEGIAWKRL